MNKVEEMGDFQKLLESVSETIVVPGLPLVARLDGRAFHTYTRGLRRPFEPWLCQTMQDTTKHLVKNTKALIGYTQSDEITLIFQDGAQAFGGRVQKNASVLAGMASSFFGIQAHEHKPGFYPHFDCRVYTVPNEDTALAALIWRQRDAVKNSVAMLAQSLYSSKELHGKKQADMHDMIKAKGLNWNDCPTHFKSGSFWARRKIEKLTEHGPVIRTEIQEVTMPWLGAVTNLTAVVFEGEDPK